VGLICMYETEHSIEGYCYPLCCTDGDCTAPSTCRPFEDWYGTFGWCTEDE
jgi:hypothetical protein